ncbi:hypothetical protein Rhal01_02991 [Rubritalea halochordaticola]|uniref:Lipopolysaccharide assembly protein A domain-containing protein n=1 Tax=Rubritalea halochordaticola TaxID=714537 RepID=A0ABP9V6U9_9BACT
MKTTKLLLLLLLVALLSALVIQNRGLLPVKFLWLSGEISGIVLLFLTAASGFVTGIIVTLLMKRSELNKKK